MVEKTIIVTNRAGVHARPAAIIAQTANKFKAQILFTKGDMEVDAKSIMGVITMAAGYNTELLLRVEGEDEVDAANIIADLFEKKFEED
ncbi:MAG: HPr family phosphocarrier protein [Treponemataceae bacterium]|nr:MAG: HPr family phosphocarrier protein [Treponemataceae bacterium]